MPRSLWCARGHALGKVTAPATGEPVKDLVRVQLVIQQLELLEKNAAKLSLDEQQLLKQSLQELRMAYVSAAGQHLKTPWGRKQPQNRPTLRKLIAIQPNSAPP